MAILKDDRPAVVPGALGMGKTTLALAAAYDARVIARFGKTRRFFFNLVPVSDADGLLRRVAANLGVDAAGAAAQVEAKIAACAAEPALVILDNLETPWQKDTAATEALLGRLAAIEGLRLVITIRGETPMFLARAPLRCKMSRSSLRTTRAPFFSTTPETNSPTTPPCPGSCKRSTAIHSRSCCWPPMQGARRI